MENETTDEKLSKLLDYFEGVPLLNITKTVKVFGNKILAVAHTKLDDDDKKWKRLGFSKKKVGKSVSKNFTKDDATEMVGKDVHTCRVAKIFPLKDLNPALRKKIRDIFKLTTPEDDDGDNEVDENDSIKPSQDFPNFSQSKTN